ncbi:tyrosine-type recombinase/integrase [Leptolyngbya sp. FACHB-36]|uniref:tyrosine-type recombinase/integrase n=1 Tax=Leptolyngbya sp. FACHB-36 TaxID=2692808 RepID=UPI0016806991|nr:tyrosine-type recombinase/integrase [Leptolyngbya sp. FACHB-36]MBD2019179.1 tyrosine-type recombinase/integrase [Leptolyngbya sp. FACHB-36]
MKVRVEAFKGWLRLRWSYDGKRHCLSLGFEDTPLARTVAEGRARTIEADILSGNFDRTLNKYKAADQQTAAITVCKLFEKFIAYKRKTSIQQRSLEKYTGLLGHLEIFFKQRSAAAIAPEDAELFREWLLTRLEPVTTSERIGLLKACWQWGIQRQLVTSNPWSGVRVRVPVKRRPAPFTQQEMKRIIDAFRSHPTYDYFADYVEFAFCTGMRTGELIGLRWRSVAADCRSIWIGEALSRGDRKETKTNKARELPLNNRLTSLLIARRTDSAAPDDLVFTTPQGKPIDDHNFRNRAWKPILRQLGIEYRKPYATRSTATNHLLDLGLSPVEVADLLGNSPRTIYTHYIGNVRRRSELPDILTD